MTIKKTKYLNAFNDNYDFENILLKLFKFNLNNNNNNINSETSLSSSLNSLFDTSSNI